MWLRGCGGIGVVWLGIASLDNAGDFDDSDDPNEDLDDEVK